VVRATNDYQRLVQDNAEALDRIEALYVSPGTRDTTPLSLPAANAAWDLRETSVHPMLTSLQLLELS
jgi:hypothetical protein